MITLKVIIETIEKICKESGVNKGVRPGPKSTYQDSYFITLIILKSLFGFSSELSFLRFLKKNKLPGLANIPEQSWYNRKAKKLTGKIEKVRILLLSQLGIQDIKIRIVANRENNQKETALPEKEKSNSSAKEYADLPPPVQDILETFQGKIKGEVLKKESP